MAAGVAYRCMVDLRVKFIRDLFSAKHDRTGNLPLFPAIFPDQLAPIVRVDGDAKETIQFDYAARSAHCSHFASMVTLLRAFDVRFVCSLDVDSTERGVLARRFRAHRQMTGND
jgi:hypothetical protein